MKTVKFSRQREAIKEYLLNTKEHPTADTIYEHIRTIIPNISLGTVYRNLNLLVSNGEILKLISKDGKDRYDALISNHYHFICDKCGGVEDLMIDSLIDIEEVNKLNHDLLIQSHDITFTGICKKCLKDISN